MRPNKYQASDVYRKEVSDEQRYLREVNKAAMLLRLGMRCVDCGITDERVLSFDHIDPRSKSSHVTALMTAKRGSKRWAALLAEVDKCEIRCLNCHHIRSKSLGHLGRPRKYGGVVDIDPVDKHRSNEPAQAGFFTS